MARFLVVLAALLSFTATGVLATTAWLPNGAPVSTTAFNELSTAIASDGNGGAIVAWYDNRSTKNDIYVQRIDALGNALWTTNGVLLTPAVPGSIDPEIVSDGAGGAIVFWEDSNAAQFLSVQRVDKDGNELWGPGGVSILSTNYSPSALNLVSDGAGGAIALWQDNRSGTADVFAQRVDNTGAVLWAADGVTVCNAANGQFQLHTASDGFGGALATWEDFRGGAQYDIYVQRVNASGTPLWTANGIALSTAALDKHFPRVTGDGGGGAIVVWEDVSAGTEAVYGMRVNASGAKTWIGTHGMAINTLVDNKNDYRVVSDGALGAIVTWRDSRNANDDIFGQRVGPTGAFYWAAQGIGLVTQTAAQSRPEPVADGAGGAVITFLDRRNTLGGGIKWDVYGTRIDGNGSPLWAADGVALCTEGEDQFNVVVTNDGAGGVLAAWTDFRTGADIYAQRVERNGHWGYPAADAVSADDVPNDQGGKVSLAWDASRLDPWPDQEINNYTLWRALTLPSAAAMLDNGVSLVDNPGKMDRKLQAAVRIEATAAGSSYWELIDTHDAYGLNNYSKVVATTGDSTSTNTAQHYFQVIAHGSFGGFWISNTIGSYSKDNLAPAPPLSLLAQRVGNDVDLGWSPSGLSEGDFSHYAIYRSESSGFTPGVGNFLATADDTMQVDTTADPGTTYYYLVTAVDTHENESNASNEADADPVPSAVRDTPGFAKLTALPNMPNPFGASGTEIHFGVPQESRVTLEVFNVRGQKVATILQSVALGAGHQMQRWNGRMSNGQLAASGVYFYRVTADAQVVTRKMVILR